MANRVLIVGWDGADWEILDPLLAAGELPNLAALIERGRKGVSRSCLPSHSWAAWPTFLTGCDPAGHGVFDILEYRPGATRRLPVSSRSILAPTWPSQLTDAGRTSLIVNVPLTYPAPEIKGVAIAGGVIPQGAHLQPSARGRARPGLADQRRLLDDLPRQAAGAAGRRRGRHPPPRRRHAAADGRAALGRGLHGLRVARPHPALPARVRAPRPSRLRHRVPDAGGRARDRRLPSARPRAGDAARAHRRRRPRAADV